MEAINARRHLSFMNFRWLCPNFWIRAVMLIIIHNIITAIASAPFELKGRGDDGEERG